MTDETTTEQLAEIEGQAADTPATEYTPPEGWRLLAVGERLRFGDMTVRKDGYCYSTERVGYFVGANQRYIRLIEPDKTQELPDKTQELPEYAPPEGWRVLRFGEQLLPGDVWVSQDGTEQRSNILHWDTSAVSGGRCIRRIEPEPQPEPEQIEELRSEVAYVQNLLGEARQRVTQLEELVASLRTINETQEKAFTAAGKENTALRLQVQNRQQEYERQKSRIEFLETLNAGNGAAIGDYIAKVAKLQSLVDTARGQLETAATEHDSLSTQLAAVKAELVTQAETSRRLQIELDAAQQVPADSPELRQLRADLAEVTQDRDTYRHAHELLLSDVNATHQRTKAMTVEAIAEWLEPVRAVDHPNLANETLQHLPQIMRHLTGLDSHAID